MINYIISIKNIVIMQCIYIFDHDQKEYDHMTNLRDDVLELIDSNVCKIQKNKRDVQISSADIIINQEYIRSTRCKRCHGLFNKLVIEYNQTHPDSPLSF